MDEKPKLFGNYEKILKFFDENSIEKLNFLFLFFIFFLFFRKFVTKNRAFGNNTIFLQQFFRFRGGGIPPSPLATPLPYSVVLNRNPGGDAAQVSFTYPHNARVCPSVALEIIDGSWAPAGGKGEAPLPKT